MQEYNLSPYDNYPPPPTPSPVLGAGQQQPLDANAAGGGSDDEEYCAPRRPYTDNPNGVRGGGGYRDDPDSIKDDDGGIVNLHDQLPAVEEYKTAADSGGSSGRRFPALCMMCSVFVAVVMAVVFASLGLANRKNNQAQQSSSNGQPSTLRGTPLYDDDQAPATRYSDIKDTLVFAGWADMKTLTSEKSATPQQEAAMWLANDDDMRVDPADTDTLRARYALAVFYESLNDPANAWSAETNFMSGDRHVCQWNAQVTGKSGREYTIGVSCNDEQQVTRLFLPGVGLRGKLPDELQLLPSLRSIDLSKNVIEGELPAGMSKLTELARLRLYDNDLSGSLPSWMGEAWSSSLSHLNLARNSFDGDFPTTLKSMTALRTLNLDDNLFNGKMVDLRGMSNVTALFLGSNFIEGPLSNSLLDSWTNLEVLDLSGMGMNSPLPSNLFVQDKLTIVDLSNNFFTGTLPYIQNGNNPIRLLALQGNALDGPLHEELEYLTDLQHLDLSDNAFTGPIPGQIGQLSSLEYLYLANNEQLDHGPIPAAIGAMQSLKDLSLKNTLRDGTIPDSFRGLKENLVLLDLDNNRLEGQIPGFLGEFPDLQFLMLNRNMFNGSIPLKFAGLTNLNLLLLDKNKIRAPADSDSGNVNPICSPDNPERIALPNLQHFVADCNGEGQPEVLLCPCCTTCCYLGDITCNNRDWMSNVDPTWQNQYVRSHFIFDDEDVVKAFAVPDGYNNINNNNNNDDIKDDDDYDDLDDDALVTPSTIIGDDDDELVGGGESGGPVLNYDEFDSMMDDDDDDEFVDDDGGDFQDDDDDNFADDVIPDDTADLNNNIGGDTSTPTDSNGQVGEGEPDAEGEVTDDEFVVDDDGDVDRDDIVDDAVDDELQDDAGDGNNDGDNGDGLGEELIEDEIVADDGGADEEDVDDEIQDDATDDLVDDATVIDGTVDGTIDGEGHGYGTVVDNNTGDGVVVGRDGDEIVDLENPPPAAVGGEQGTAGAGAGEDEVQIIRDELDDDAGEEDDDEFVDDVVDDDEFIDDAT